MGTLILLHFFIFLKKELDLELDMSHFPNHPIDQTQFTLSEIFDERQRLSNKWFKTKADKKALEVLDEASQHLIRNGIKGLLGRAEEWLTNNPPRR